MRQTTRLDSLMLAKSNKRDEFYTKLEDIEAEVFHYSKHFRNKTVYLNCDDPRYSNFFRFFVNEFYTLGLKAVIASGLDQSVQRDNAQPLTNGVWAEYIGKEDCPESLLPGKAVLRRLTDTGDFRGLASRHLLDRADIVVTNPPFSLFHEYFSLLIESQKSFLILGNMNAVTYPEVFPRFKDGTVWYGCSIHSGDREFLVPSNYPLEAAGCRVDESGNRFIRVKGVRWFTNMRPDVTVPFMTLKQSFHAYRYPEYANYSAIEVGRTANIPADYYGEMGVPISFLDHYNPNQFEIVGSSNTLARPMKDIADPGTYQTGGPRFYLQCEDGSYRRMYERIVIKRRQDN